MSKKERAFTKLLKVAILGDPAVGKTSLVIRYAHGYFREEYLKTVGTTFSVRDVEVGDEVIRLQVWDITGEEKFGRVIPHFLRGASGFVIAYDLTRDATLFNIPRWALLTKVVETNSESELPMVLLGNKVDLLSTRETQNAPLLKELQDQFNFISMFQTSAKTAENVDSAFKALVEAMIK